MMSRNRRQIPTSIGIAATIVVLAIILIFTNSKDEQEISNIDGRRMLLTIGQQLGYGPRFMGSPGHDKMQRFLTSAMQEKARTLTQSWQYMGTGGKNHELTNIIGRINPSKEKRIILGTHYDSKRFADKDPKHKDQPVPGANDSASGVAVLLELAQKLHEDAKQLDVGVDFVFFDGEEGDINLGGNYDDWEPLGSTYFAEHIDSVYTGTKPSSALVIDMVCDKDLTIYKEKSSVRSAPAQVNEFWDIAQRTNSETFKPQVKYQVQDDHTPLNNIGIPSFLLIDFDDYQHFHTTKDTIDKCSAESLQTVAQALLKYIYSLD